MKRRGYIPRIYSGFSLVQDMLHASKARDYVEFVYQNSPDGCAREPRHLLVTKDSTIGELLSWAAAYVGGQNGTRGAQFPCGPITIMVADEKEAGRG